VTCTRSSWCWRPGGVRDAPHRAARKKASALPRRGCRHAATRDLAPECPH
jgi:hypothetical protein